MNNKTKKLELKNLREKIYTNLSLLEGMSFLEKIAIFMGKVQIIELALKQLLINKYGYEEEKIEKITLGQTIYKLKKVKLSEDFIDLLEELKTYRNSIAHDMLAVHLIGVKLVGSEFERLSWKELKHGLWIAEEVIQIYDFLVENKLL